MTRFVIFIFFLCAPLMAQHGYSPGDIADGQRFFGNTCAVCHGPEGDAVPGVDLAHGKFRRAVTDADLVRIIRNGIPGTAMPPSRFDEFAAGTIVAYMRSMASFVSATSSIPGSAERGQALFEGKGNCTNCHRVLTKGSRMGPDLTEIGASRRAVQLEKSILEPDAEVLPQNRFVHVSLKDGGAIDGRLLNQDGYSIQIFDSKERLVTVDRAKVREFRFAAKSPMPPYQDKLSPQELADLVKYLTSLKGVEAQ